MLGAPASTPPRPASESPRRLAFVPAFDGVRGIAVLLVVSYHLRLLDDDLYAHVLPKGGSLGVDIFFVLSGFLITSLLLGEQSANGRARFRAFYRRRALRLLPALAVLVLAQVLYAWNTHVPGSVERSSVLSVVFYVANWKIALGHTFPLIAPGFAHLWSLAVEEQFYIVWPLVVALALGLRRRAATVATVMTAGVVAVVVARAALVRHTAPGLLYFRTDMRLDALLVGALAGQLWVRRSVPTRGLAPAAWAGLAFVTVCVVRFEFNARFLFYGGYTLLAIGTALVLLAIAEGRVAAFTRVLEWAPLRAVGRVSYGLYLWHYFVFVALAHHSTTWSPGPRIVLGLALAATATVASWYVVERPFLVMKNHAARRAQTPAAT